MLSKNVGKQTFVKKNNLEKKFGKIKIGQQKFLVKNFIKK